MKKNKEFIKETKKRIREIITYIKILGFGIFKWLLLKKEKKYSYFQKRMYNYLASISKYSPNQNLREYVVGSYKEHDRWKDYDEYLMKYVDETFLNKLALDFGTGPGRNIVKYHAYFKRLDGMDISEINIENAKKNLANHHVEAKLYVNNGRNLADITDNFYDFVMSTITLQHICSHDIRYNLMKEFFRVLRPNGRISLQMGYGNVPNSVGYAENDWNALETNGGRDTRVESSEELRNDLEKIGFKNFEYWIRPSGPGGAWKQWIFFAAIK